MSSAIGIRLVTSYWVSKCFGVLLLITEGQKANKNLWNNCPKPSSNYINAEIYIKVKLLQIKPPVHKSFCFYFTQRLNYLIKIL